LFEFLGERVQIRLLGLGRGGHGLADEAVDEVDVGGQVGREGFDGSADEDEFVGGFVGEQADSPGDGLTGGRAIGAEEFFGLIDEEGAGEFPTLGDGLESAVGELFQGVEASVEGLFETFIEL